jgi:hypothetical protein
MFLPEYFDGGQSNVSLSQGTWEDLKIGLVDLGLEPGPVMVWFQFLFYNAKLGFGVCCSFSEIARLQSTKRFALVVPNLSGCFLATQSMWVLNVSM